MQDEWLFWYLLLALKIIYLLPFPLLQLYKFENAHLRWYCSYSKAYSRMGLAYSSVEKHNEAVDCFKRAIEIEPDNESYKTNLELAKDRLVSAKSAGNSAQGIFLSFCVICSCMTCWWLKVLKQNYPNFFFILARLFSKYWVNCCHFYLR